MGHQIKECEVVEELNEEGFEDIEEQDLAFGQWLRAFPLPKHTDEFNKHDSSSSLCSRELFNASSNQSRCETKGKDKGKDVEVQQVNVSANQQSGGDRGKGSKNQLDVENS